MSTQPAFLCPDMPVIDDTRLMAEFGDDSEILAELRDLFLEHIPPLHENIVKAIDSHDTTAIATDVHSLKGACATYGAPRLAHTCKAIETAVKAEDWDLIIEYKDTFEEEFQKVAKALAGI